MLVLTRKTKQQIRIGDNVTITILMVKGQTVRVGIEAPNEVRVLRAELPVFEDGPALSIKNEPTVTPHRRASKMSICEPSSTPQTGCDPRMPSRTQPTNVPRAEWRSRLPGPSDASKMCNRERLGSGPLSAMVSSRASASP